MTMCFMDYWDAVDAQMLRLYGIDTLDAGIETYPVAEAQDAGWTPREFALWFGEKYDLTKLSGAA
jgi:hypothetical protein